LKNKLGKTDETKRDEGFTNIEDEANLAVTAANTAFEKLPSDATDATKNDAL